MLTILADDGIGDRLPKHFALDSLHSLRLYDSHKTRWCRMGFSGRIFLRILVVSLLTTDPHGFTLAAVPSTSTNGCIAKKPICCDKVALRFGKFGRWQTVTSLRAGGGDSTLENKEEPTLMNKVGRFADKNFFLVGLFFAVLFAKAFPFVSYWCQASEQTCFILANQLKCYRSGLMVEYFGQSFSLGSMGWG